uniref:Capsid protein n=1 Tax=Cressdnaviricota sp. TaxID=2748378 RepID=A0A890V235_9VIRU|nr:MAG: capsid protein [Cressdnaviricota sp.]
MPYARRTRKAAPMRRRRYARKPAGPPRSVLTKVVRRVNTLARRFKPEVKIVQQGSTVNVGAINGVGVNGAALDGPLALTSQGTGGANRVGNVVNLLSMQIKGFVAQQSSTSANRKVVLMLIQELRHTQSSVALSVPLLVNDFMDLDARTGTLTTQSYRTFDNMSNWRVLARKTVYLKADNFASQATETTYNMYVKFRKPIRMNYSGGPSFLDGGAIYLLMLADNGDISAGSLTGTRVTYDIRSLFTDS